MEVKNLWVLGKRGTWIAEFILGRVQGVKVNTVASTWAQVISGVPQGLVLGPLLFLIFIGVLGANFIPGEAKILKYVDDTKIIKPLKMLNSSRNP